MRLQQKKIILNGGNCDNNTNSGCDFYIVGNKIYFGELTFTPAGGMHTSQTKIDGKDMTDFLDLDNINM